MVEISGELEARLHNTSKSEYSGLEKGYAERKQGRAVDAVDAQIRGMPG